MKSTISIMIHNLTSIVRYYLIMQLVTKRNKGDCVQ